MFAKQVAINGEGPDIFDKLPTVARKAALEEYIQTALRKDFEDGASEKGRRKDDKCIYRVIEAYKMLGDNETMVKIGDKFLGDSEYDVAITAYSLAERKDKLIEVGDKALASCLYETVIRVWKKAYKNLDEDRRNTLKCVEELERKRNKHSHHYHHNYGGFPY